MSLWIFFVYQGYALIEYENYEEAQAAISGMNGAEFLTQTVIVDWAFSNGSFVDGSMKKKNNRFAFKTYII